MWAKVAVRWVGVAADTPSYDQAAIGSFDEWHTLSSTHG